MVVVAKGKTLTIKWLDFDRDAWLETYDKKL
jgi:hypothetical protein